MKTTSEAISEGFECDCKAPRGHAPWCRIARHLPGSESCANLSGLHPIGHAVLLFPYEPEIVKSRIIIPDTVRKSTTMVESRAVVVEVGPSAWSGEPPRAVPGDKVLIGKYAGSIAVGIKDDKVYRLVNSDDIYCRLED